MPDQAVKYARWLGVQKLWLTQVGHTYPPHEQADAGIKAYAVVHAPELDAAVAHDGLRLKGI
jgi:hypothetical protein